MSRFHVDPNERVDIAEFEPGEFISETPPNVITIRARMTVEIAGRVSSELVKLGEGNKTEAHLGAHTGALLLHNILGWRGPDFDDLPCTPDNIRALPSGDPFIEKVVNEIGQRNRKRESPNGRSRTEPGSKTNGSPGASPQNEPGISARLATGTSRSDSRSALAGHLRRSVGSIPTISPNSSDD